MWGQITDANTGLTAEVPLDLNMTLHAALYTVLYEGVRALFVSES